MYIWMNCALNGINGRKRLISKSMAFLSMKPERFFMMKMPCNFLIQIIQKMKTVSSCLELVLNYEFSLSATVFGKVRQLLELYRPGRRTAKKKMNIGGIDDERSLRFFKNERA